MLYVQDIDAKAGSTFEIPVTKDWERHDVYVTALVFRGGTRAQQDHAGARGRRRACADGSTRSHGRRRRWRCRS